VLGFRKEWLSEVKAALETHRVARTEHRLDQLTRGGVLEAITGPTRVPQRRMPVRLEVERDLDVQIADDLLANRASHVAPLLQILLAEMWTEAPRRGDVVRFDVALYDTVRAKAKQLDAFLTEQLEALRAWHAPAVESGLALDYLRFHTTPKGTADERTVAETRESYPTASSPSPGLRAMCARLFLLVERSTDDADAAHVDRPARLAHDTLAPLVRERFDRSEAPGPRARRILEGRVAEWSDGHVGVPLDEQDLGLVEAGVSGMRAWTADETRLIEASRVSRDRARRRRAWVMRGAVTAVIAIAGFGVGSWILYRQAQTRLAESQSRELAGRAAATAASRRDLALLYAVSAYERSPTFDARRALLGQLAASEHMIRLFDEPRELQGELAFTPDGQSIALGTADSVFIRNIVSGRAVATLSPSPYGGVNLGREGTTFSGIARRDSANGVAIRHVPGDTMRIGVWEIRSKRQVGAMLPTPGDGEPEWLVAPVLPGKVTWAAVTDVGGIAIWDVAARRMVRHLGGRAAGASPRAFSRDGTVLVAVKDPDQATVWDVTTGKQLLAISSPSDGMASVHLYTLTNDVLVVSDGDTLSLWPLAAGSAPQRVPYTGVHALALSGNDSVLAIGGNDGRVSLVRVPAWNQPDGWKTAMESATVLQADGIVPEALALSANGRRVAATTIQEMVLVWDLDAPALVETIALPMVETGHVVGLSPDGRFAASRSDSAFVVWDAATGRTVRRLPHAQGNRPVGMVGTAALIPSSPFLTTAVASSGRFIVDEPTSEPVDARIAYVADAGGTTRTVNLPSQVALAFDPTSDRIARGLPGTHAVVLTSLSDATRADTLDAGPGAQPLDTAIAPNAAFSADGSVLAVTVTPQLILVWDLAARRVRDSLVVRSDTIGDRVHASAGGRVIAAVTRDAVLFWRAGARDPFARVASTSRFAALSADGSLFAMENAVVTLVDATRGEVLGTIPLGEVRPESRRFVVGLAFVDARQLRVAHDDGRISVVNTDPDWWARHACSVAASAAATRRWGLDAPSGTSPPRRCDR
jgi:WD40 repeat protein